ncbi:SIR2 family protein [Aliarcobacter butzleri]|jgi:ABC-type dipeptide/oligopeptide/nickel transport system ATPase component|uniref:P-loop NTPase n=1 Tax=Aliarcobacter butzleri TaxID=28197 RepID=UPI00263D6B70|nr:SIR2 family protein [Aliarcobacter butzleri]MDN5125875.1 SIR2 family protein [Aliarcobacter butzleri]
MANNYEFDYSKHYALIEKIFRGEVILFTGAGFSLESQVRGKDILSTDALVTKIIEELLEYKEEAVDRIKKNDFRKICQLAINKVTEEVFRDFLVKNFSYTVPKEFHKDYAKVKWKEIFTLNIDDLIETIYANTDTIIQSYNTIIQPVKDVEENVIPYYKLHGDVRNKSEGFVFSTNQYLGRLVHSDPIPYNYVELGRKLYHDTFCVIGTKLDEIDLDFYNTKFAKSMGSSLPNDKIFYVKRTVHPEDILELQNKNIIFIQETTKTFIEKLLAYQERYKNENKLNNKNHDNKNIFPKIGFNCIEKINNLYPEDIITNHKPISFYSGYEVTWLDIVSQSDAILTNTINIIKDISTQNKFNLQLLLGKSGNGKTTCLHRIMYDFSLNDDYIVLNYNENIQITDENAKLLAKTINNSSKNFLIVFDNGSWAFNFISNLYKYLDTNKCVNILVSSRIPDYYREMRNLQNVPNKSISFDDNISFENAKILITKKEEKTYLGGYAEFKDIDKRAKAFLNSFKNKNDLFSSLIEATDGKGFYKNINSKIRDVIKDKANAHFLLVLIIFDSFNSFSLPIQFYFDIFERRIKSLKKIISDCSDLLNNINLQDYGNLKFYVRPRGNYITKSISKEILRIFSEKEILDITKEILIHIATKYDINYVRGKNLYTEISHSLLVSKFYYKIFNINIKDNEKLYDDFYHSLSSYFGENSDFWLQYAKMEMKLGDYPSAKIHLEQAIALNPKSYKIKHAIGQLHILKSLTYDNFEEAKKEFEIGEKIMISQIEINDAYPIHSYVDGFIQFHKKFKFQLENNKVKELYNVIKYGLEKFNNHALLLIIWKKYYRYLQKNNKTSLIKISIEDMNLMKHIDVRKDAEEQYMI